LVDLDGDGINDLLSGSWPGEIFFFKGRGKGEFDPPIKLKDKTGKTINIGGGIKRDDDRELLIAGDAKFETKNGKTIIIYEGKEYQVSEDRSGGITGTASAVYAADLDGDGDLDLIVGDVYGNVYLLPNEGTAKAWAWGHERKFLVNRQPLKVEGDAGPIIADWNGDGKPDLLVGSGDGSVKLYLNTGKVEPESNLAMFGDAKVLVPKVSEDAANQAAPHHGVRSKICVADWNGDGKPDLLVGDFSLQKAVHPDPTPEQKAEQDKARAEMKQLQPTYSRLVSQLFSSNDKKLAADERKKAMEEFQDVEKKMDALRGKIPAEEEQHGWVWIYLRKPVP